MYLRGCRHMGSANQQRHHWSGWPRSRSIFKFTFRHKRAGGHLRYGGRYHSKFGGFQEFLFGCQRSNHQRRYRHQQCYCHSIKRYCYSGGICFRQPSRTNRRHFQFPHHLDGRLPMNAAFPTRLQMHPGRTFPITITKPYFLSANFLSFLHVF